MNSFKHVFRHKMATATYFLIFNASALFVGIKKEIKNTHLFNQYKMWDNLDATMIVIPLYYLVSQLFLSNETIDYCI